MKNKLDIYIYRILKITLVAILLCPFVVSSVYYFPFSAPRTFLFRILVSLALAMYLFLYFRNKEKFSFGKSKLLLSYFAFAIIMTISSIVAGDFAYSFWSKYERMDGLVTIYYLLAYLIVLLGVYNYKKGWLEFLRASVFASGIMAIIAFAQNYDINIFIASAGGERVTGATGNAIFLAVYSLFNIFFAFYLLLKDKREKLKIDIWGFYALDLLLLFFEMRSPTTGTLGAIFSDFKLALVFLLPQILIHLNYYLKSAQAKISRYSYQAYFVLLIVLNFLAIFNSQTRGVLLGIFVAFVFTALFFIFSKQASKLFKKISIVLLLLAIVSVAGIFVGKDSSFVQGNYTLSRIANFSIDDTTEARFLLWDAAWKGFQEKPILGYGQEKYYYVFNKHFPPEIFKDTASRVWFDRAHNIYLDQLIFGGIFGLAIYLAIFFFAFKNLYSYYRRSKDLIVFSIFNALLIAYLVQNFFAFDSVNSYVLLIPTLAITIFLSNKAKKEDTSKPKEHNYLSFSLAAIVLIVGLSINIAQANANRHYVTQLDDIRAGIDSIGDYDQEDVDRLVEIINSQYLGKYELSQSYVEGVTGLIGADILTAQQLQYFVDTAEEQMLAVIDEQPDNVLHQNYLSNFYLAASSLDVSYSQKAVDLIENKSLALSPERVHLYYYLGRAYIILGDNEKSLESFEKALELSPNVFESYYNLIFYYLVQEDIETARQIEQRALENIDDFRVDYYSRMMTLYNFFDYRDDVKRIAPIVQQKEN